MGECSWWQVGCNVKEIVAEVASTAIGQFVVTLAQGVVSMLGWINSFWLMMPAPDVQSGAVPLIQRDLSWYTFAFAVLGVLIAAGRMVMTGQFRAGSGALRMLVNLIVTTGAMAAGFTALTRAGDAFAPWIVMRATGEEMSVEGLLTVATLMNPGVGPGLLLALLAFLGAIANVAFMVVRSAMVALTFAFLPTVAAASGSETGAKAFRTTLGWLGAFVLYKPVAGVIYALGILMIKNPPTFEIDAVGLDLYNAIVAVVILAAAALALPALIKFVVPVAANGTSGVFSGGAVAAGAVAAGAAVVTLTATGGAGAAAGGGAAKGGGTGAGAGVAAQPAGGAPQAAGGTTQPAGARGGAGGGSEGGPAGGSAPAKAASTQTGGDSGTSGKAGGADAQPQTPSAAGAVGAGGGQTGSPQGPGHPAAAEGAAASTPGGPTPVEASSVDHSAGTASGSGGGAQSTAAALGQLSPVVQNAQGAIGDMTEENA